MNRDTLLELIPAYALDALDDADRAEIEALLNHDAEAQQILDEYRQIAETFALAAPAQTAPAHLQRDLRQRLAGTKAQHRSKPARITQLSFTWLAAAAIVVLFGAALFLSMSAAHHAGAELYTQLSTQPEARQLPLAAHLNDQINGDLLIAADGRQAVIRVRQLPQLEPDQAFQLWLVDADGSISGGVYQFDNPLVWNYMVLPLEKAADQYLRFGVSIEPAEGSPLGNRPTGPRVFNVVLSGGEA